MQFDLVHRRYDACIACDALQVIDCEVRDVDRPHAPLFSQLDEGTPRIDIGLALGARPVNQVEIDHFEPEPVRACIEGTQRLIITLTVVPKLRRHVELVARHDSLLQGSPDPRLVPVIRGGVDQTIAGVDRGSDDFRRVLVSTCQTPNPSCGIDWPSLRRMRGTSGLALTVRLEVVRRKTAWPDLCPSRPPGGLRKELAAGADTTGDSSPDQWARKPART
jgi:hypothetical protein